MKLLPVWLLLLVMSTGSCSVSTHQNQTKELNLDFLNEFMLSLCFSILRILKNLLGISMESEILFTQPLLIQSLLKPSHPKESHFPWPRLVNRLPDKFKVHPLTLFSLFYDFGFNSSLKTNNTSDFGHLDGPEKQRVKPTGSTVPLDLATNLSWPSTLPDDYHFDLVDMISAPAQPSYGYRQRVRALEDQRQDLKEKANYSIIAVNGAEPTFLKSSALNASTLVTDFHMSNVTILSNVTAIDFAFESDNHSVSIAQSNKSETFTGLLNNTSTDIVLSSKVKLDPQKKLHEAYLDKTRMKHQRLLDYINRIKLINQQKLANHTAKHRQHMLQKKPSQGWTGLFSPLAHVFQTVFNLLDRVLTPLIIIPGEAFERAVVRIFRNLYDDLRLLYQMTRTLLGTSERACRYKLLCQLSNFATIHVPDWLKRQIPTSGEEYFVSVVEAASDNEVLNAALTGMMGFECGEIYQSLSCI